jgi:hypothetical protein
MQSTLVEVRNAMIVVIAITAVWAIAMLLLVFSARPRRRMIVCPLSGNAVRVRFLESVPRGRPIDVTACSAFTPPDAVKCGQRCLGLLARPAMPLEGERPCSPS